MRIDRWWRLKWWFLDPKTLRGLSDLFGYLAVGWIGLGMLLLALWASSQGP